MAKIRTRKPTTKPEDSLSGGKASPGFSWFDAIISRIASVTLSDRRASRSMAWKTAGVSLWADGSMGQT